MTDTTNGDEEDAQTKTFPNGRRCKDARIDDESIHSEEDAAQVSVQKVEYPHVKKTPEPVF